MIQIRFFLLGLFAMLTASLAAQQYTSSDKKAIRFFEDAAGYMELREVQAGLESIGKALERDPNFVEAWLLKADFHIQSGQREQAIAAMERSVAILPDFFPNKYYTLGQLYLDQEEYDKAQENFEKLLGYREVRSELKGSAQRKIDNCAFAQIAVQHPVDFDPQNIGPGINSWMPEYYPSMTVDGEQMLFTREVMQEPGRGRGQEDFYLSTWDGETWQEAQPLKYINTGGNEGAPAISPDGQNMIFTACDLYGSYGPEREGFGSCDLFFSYKLGNRWARARNMGPNINTAHWESQPSISADGKTLFFVRGNRNPQKRNSDIYMSVLTDGEWGPPVRLNSTINTSENEESVLIHPDGKTLYFSSAGHPGMGGLDIYMSTRLGENEWSEPINLGYPINTSADENSLLVSPQGDVAYFSSDRLGGEGMLDLYSFELPKPLRPEPVGYLKGLVYDAETKESLFARFELIDLETGEVVITSFSNSEDGTFLVALPTNRKYALNASKKGYLFYSDHFDLSDGSAYASGKTLEVPMQKIAGGQKIVLNNVFFDTDKFNLKDESRAELNKLTDFMTQNPTVSLEIGGHTDNQGSAAHNQQLSENRANAVLRFLVDQGITSDRLSAKGYGQDEPIATNDTAEGRALNRRTEVKVID